MGDDWKDIYNPKKEWEIVKNVWKDGLVSSQHDCQHCEKQLEAEHEQRQLEKREDKKKRELEAELVAGLTEKLEALKVESGDILMIRVDGKKPGVPEMLNAFRKVFEQAKKKDVWIIAIPSDMVLEQIKPKDFNPAGWYRKEQLVDPDVWKDKKEKIHQRRIVVEDSE